MFLAVCKEIEQKLDEDIDFARAAFMTQDAVSGRDSVFSEFSGLSTPSAPAAAAAAAPVGRLSARAAAVLNTARAAGPQAHGPQAAVKTPDGYHMGDTTKSMAAVVGLCVDAPRLAAKLGEESGTTYDPASLAR